MFPRSRREPASGGMAVAWVLQGSSDLLLAETGAVVAIDQQCDAPAPIDMPRPAERVVEGTEFLEQKLILVQRRDRLGTAWADIDAIAHDAFSISLWAKTQREPAALRPRLPVLFTSDLYLVAKWADRKAPSSLTLRRWELRSLHKRS